MNLAGPFVPSRGNKVATVDSLQNYELAFTMVLDSDWRRKDKYRSILHIGDSNDQYLPKIGFHSRYLSVKQSPGNWGVQVEAITFTERLDGSSSSKCNFAAGGTYDIKVLVANNTMIVYVDGVSVGTASGPTTEVAEVATDAAVYVGDPWHGSAKVTLSDISYTRR